MYLWYTSSLDRHSEMTATVKLIHSSPPHIRSYQCAYVCVCVCVCLSVSVCICVCMCVFVGGHVCTCVSVGGI